MARRSRVSDCGFGPRPSAVLGLAVLLLACPGASAAHGIVRTTEGRVWRGELSLEGSALLVRPPGLAVTNRVGLEQLAQLRVLPQWQVNAPADGPLCGLRGTYFKHPELSGDSVMRLDPTVDFDWQQREPVKGFDPQQFSVRWEGQVEPPASEKFTFYTLTDDGVRLWVQGRALIEQWAVRGLNEHRHALDLEAGRRYDLRLEYCNHGGPAQARLQWSSPSVFRTIIPAGRLSPPGAPRSPAGGGPPPAHGLLRLAFNTPDLTGDFRACYDPQVDFDWGEGPPLDAMKADGFSVRWLGRLTPERDDLYTFHTRTRGGVRLWVGGRLLIDAWRNESLKLNSEPIPLRAGQPVELKMEMFNQQGSALARLSWSGPSMPATILPSNRLTPAPVPEAATVVPLKKQTPPGVVLVGGSVLARPVVAADTTAVRFSDSSKEAGLSMIKVARLVFQALSPELEARLPAGRRGVLLKSQEFIDGDLREVKNGRVRLSSMLFGLKSYDAWQVLAVALRDPQPVRACYEVRTSSGSLLLADELGADKDGLVVHGADLAGFKVALGSLTEIQRVK